MKTPFYITLLVLVCGLCSAEEPRLAQMARNIMKDLKWETKDVTFDETDHQSSPLIIRRSGKVVAYYVDESVWQRRDVENKALSKTTKIVFGYGDPKFANLFVIDNADEIKLWVAAYQNHTEFERRYAAFIPLNSSAGFKITREEYKFGESCMCSLALRFHVDNKVVLELDGHLHQNSGCGSGVRNFVLHKLAKMKVPKKVEVLKGGDKLEKFPDLFNNE